MAEATSWQPGTLWDNIDAVAGAIGIDQPGLVWGLAQFSWPSTDERDAFLRAVVSQGGTA